MCLPLAPARTGMLGLVLGHGSNQRNSVVFARPLFGRTKLCLPPARPCLPSRARRRSSFSSLFRYPSGGDYSCWRWSGLELIPFLPSRQEGSSRWIDWIDGDRPNKAGSGSVYPTLEPGSFE